MSEIAKCPICGESPAQVDHGWNSTCDFYECCGVLAEEEKWNQIATLLARHNSLKEAVRPVVTRYIKEIEFCQEHLMVYNDELDAEARALAALVREEGR